MGDKNLGPGTSTSPAMSATTKSRTVSFALPPPPPPPPPPPHQSVIDTLARFKKKLKEGKLKGNNMSDANQSTINTFTNDIASLDNDVIYNCQNDYESLLKELNDSATKYNYNPTKIASLITYIDAIISTLTTPSIGGKKRRSKRHKKRHKKRNRKTFKRKY